MPSAAFCTPRSEYVPRSAANTALHRLVAEHYATFEQVAAADDTSLPRFVSDAFLRFLRCGVLAHGFARFRCDTCRHEHLVPLSCKSRGLCPSCDGRRMAELTSHLLHHVLPQVPVRQWVLTLPPPLRYRLAYDHTLCTAVHRILSRAIRSLLRRTARKRGDHKVDTGSVTFVQRYGSGLNLNVHYHLLSLDGWFCERSDGSLRFVHAPTLSQADVEKLVLRIYRRVLRLLRARGLLEEPAPDELRESSPVLAACYEGAVSQRVALGPRRGRPVMKLPEPLLRILANAGAHVEARGKLCAHLDGFDLHGRVTVSAHARHRLQELVRYCARPALAHERLTRRSDGRYLLRLKTPYHDGTTHLCFEPLELMERLATQIPKPRVNLVLYAGVLAPHASRRRQAVAYGHEHEEQLPEQEARQTRAERNRWSELMRSTFGLDVLACPKCDGRLHLLAVILDMRVARRILAHLGQSAMPAASAPARDPPPFWECSSDH